MRDASFDFLKTLLETPSPSGFETRGQGVWASYAGQFADKVESDTYGNVFAELNVDASPKIAIVGHSDELGLMISYISEEGYLYFKGIGGVDRAMLRGRRVFVHGRGGPVPGVTGHLAIHLQESDDRKKVPGISRSIYRHRSALAAGGREVGADRRRGDQGCQPLPAWRRKSRRARLR